MKAALLVIAAALFSTRVWALEVRFDPVARGAEVIAHPSAPADMQARGGDQLAALRALLGTHVEGTVAVMPTRLVNGLDAGLNLGGMAFEFKHRGGGHTPGDMVVWLPSSKVLFTGDIVYTDRLLAILPVSNTRSWLDSFAAVEQLTPSRIVPGHGEVTDLARARAHTHDYLAALRAHAKRAVDEGIDIDVAVKVFDSKPFQSLLNASELMSGNANRVYLEVERE